MKKEKNKAIFPSLDLTDLIRLPERYFFNNQEILTENKFIDDNSLFIYYCLAIGLFSNPSSKINPVLSFIMFHPFEWTKIDFVSFLLSVSKNYDLKIENIVALFGTKEGNYEIPKQYEGDYKWILELKEKEPNREEVLLFNKFLTDTASVLDLERALIYSTRITSPYKNELYLSKDIFKKILTNTHFSFSLNSIQKSKLKDDINFYIEEFIQGKLVRNNESKVINNISVFQSENIFTFKKHSLLFRRYLQKMQDDCGNIITIENTFEDGFPKSGYQKSENVRNRYAERSFLFLHILFAFEKQGLLKILFISNNWGSCKNKKLTYQAKIEILPAFFNEDSSKENVKKDLIFNDKESILSFNNKEIKISKTINSNGHYLLKTIFKDKNKVWEYDEIAEDWTEDYKKDDGSKYYYAGYTVNGKVAKETTIKDFLIITSKMVHINKKYL